LLFLRAKVHQQLIFYTARGVGGQLGTLGVIKGVDGFNQPDTADGYQLVGVVGFGVVFFDNMRHQTEIPFNKDVPRGAVAVGHPFQVFPLLSGGQRLRKRGIILNVQNQQQKISANQRQ